MKSLTDLTDPFNYHVKLLRQQAEGVIQGYLKYSPSNEV